MNQFTILISFSVLVVLGVIHIFEEIAMKAYELHPLGGLKKYLIVSSMIVSFQIVSFLGISLDMLFGYIMGIIVSLFGILNGVIHSIGFIRQGKEKNLTGTLASGFYSGIMLFLGGITVLVFIALFLS